MAKIVRYELNHIWQEMLIDLDIGDRLPDEIKILCNNMVFTFRDTKHRIQSSKRKFST